MINFISDILDSASNTVESTGNATKKIITAANPAEKREHETTEEYEIRLKHFRNEKEIHNQSRLESEKNKLEYRLEEKNIYVKAQLEKEKIKLERTKIQAQLKREEREAKIK